MNDLLSLARERRALLAELMASDPGAVLDAALPDETRRALPAQVQALLEQPVAVEGEIEVLYEDYADGHARLLHFLKVFDERFALHFRAAPPGLLSGTAVKASGVQLDTAMALESGESILTLAAGGGTNGGSNGGTPAAVPGTLGEQRTLVMLVNFQDNASQPYGVEDARSLMFGTTSNFYLENSQQQTWLSGKVAGWFTIASSSSVCDTTTIATQAKAAASAAGFNPGAYSHLVYAFPQITCGWWGLSSVGGSPSETWITGRFELGVTAHELGHGLGLFHSHSLDCGSTILGTGCEIYEYGDTFDMMGASSFAHFNAFQKERLGWLNAGVSPPITRVVADGTYVIDAYESAGTGPKALKILKSTDPTTGQRTWYYVQSRQAIGFDSGLTGNANILNGILILEGTEANGNSSYLLDMTPGSGSWSGSSIYWDWKDPALVSGQSFEDSEAGIAITTEWVTVTQAGVTVRLGARASDPPAMAVSTDQPSYSRGQTIYISATLTSGGYPLVNASVSFTITKPNGAVVNRSAATGSDGIALYPFRLRKQDPLGTYQVTAATTDNGMSASAIDTFTVD
jgi:hypothetical protein